MSNTLLFWIFIVVAVLVVIWALRKLSKNSSRRSSSFWDDIDFGGGFDD
jgi:flagellar biogenesis protein FliO